VLTKPQLVLSNFSEVIAKLAEVVCQRQQPVQILGNLSLEVFI
jgi:hypothetical protein